MTYKKAVQKLLENSTLPKGQLWIPIEMLEEIAKKLDDDKD